MTPSSSKPDRTHASGVPKEAAHDATDPIGAKIPAGTPPPELSTARPKFETDPLSRPEYFFAVSHFYRGEVDRPNAWRVRIDATTNWAVASAAAFSGFALSHPEVPHLVALFGNLVVFALLWIETRRFRVFDVFRARARKTEENFFGPILARDLNSPELRWGCEMSNDLLRPEFPNTFWEVMGLRLRRNYMFLFLVLLASWLVKVFVLDPPAGIVPTGSDWYDRVGMFGTPPWLVVSTLVAFYGFLFVLLLRTHAKRRYMSHHWGTGANVKWYDC